MALPEAFVPSKCALIKHSFKGDVQQHDDWTVKIDGSPVEVIKRGETEDTRYLGSFFNDKPKSSTTIEKLIKKVKNRLDLLTVANLPLRYKIVALSQWVASSCTYVLLNEKMNLGHVDQIELLINDSVRSWFRLPHNTNIEMLTIAFSNGGLALPNIRKDVLFPSSKTIQLPDVQRI